MALAQPAAAQSPAEAERAIRDQRAAFNRAIAAVLADNVQMITGSDSIHVAGKQAHLDRWVEGFKDPNRLVYVRSTDRVTVFRCSPSPWQPTTGAAPNRRRVAG